MKIELTGKHIEITAAIRQHVETQCAKIKSFFKGKTEAQAHVVVMVEKNRQKAEIIVNWREHTLTARETDKDLYQAVSKAVEKLEKQAQRLKEKVVDRKHSAPKMANLAPEPEGEVDAAPLPPQIIATDSKTLKPMTPEEAVLSLSMDKNQFVVFRDTDTESMSVVYKRADGNFGLIQP